MKSKLCPYKKTCLNECYGDYPCSFAKAFDRLTLQLEQVRAERDLAISDMRIITHDPCDVCTGRCHKYKYGRQGCYEDSFSEFEWNGMKGEKG